MKKRVLKKKKNKVRLDRLFLLITLFSLIVSVFVLLFILVFKDPFIDKGYSKEEAIFFKTYDKDIQKIILEKDYDIRYYQISLEKDYKFENIKLYYDYIEKYKDAEPYEIVYATNHSITIERYRELNNNIFSNDKYYLIRNYDRYKIYFEKNGYTESVQNIRDTVASVNTNVDREFYSDTLKADISKKELMLVNKYYYLDNNYVALDLVDIDYNLGVGKLNQVAYDNFKKMYSDALSEGISLYINSPYRSFTSQYQLYNEYSSSIGEVYAEKYSARAGFSEHQTGYVIDVVSADESESMDAFENTKAYQWMVKNAYKYGFIQHYQLGKEKYTGYAAESWHYRYVGDTVAKYLKENDITFDEYYEFYVRGENE